MLGQGALALLPGLQPLGDVAAVAKPFHEGRQGQAGLHRHAASLAEIRRLGVGGVTHDGSVAR
ncbi:hypothetical protein D3C75_1106280 [compost metagenome]